MQGWRNSRTCSAGSIMGPALSGRVFTSRWQPMLDSFNGQRRMLKSAKGPPETAADTISMASFSEANPLRVQIRCAAPKTTATFYDRHTLNGVLWTLALTHSLIPPDPVIYGGRRIIIFGAKRVGSTKRIGIAAILQGTLKFHTYPTISAAFTRPVRYVVTSMQSPYLAGFLPLHNITGFNAVHITIYIFIYLSQT